MSILHTTSVPTSQSDGERASQDRADLHNADREPHGIVCGSQVWLYLDREPHAIVCGSQVWLYLDRVKEGYARKLAHMWHGPFRVEEVCGDHAVRLEIAISVVPSSFM